jgi:prevent-host-death family protein
MAMVTSAEAQKNFGRSRERALEEPVVVTQYGKPSVVIISAAEYERLKELDRRVMLLDEMSDAEIEEMAASEIPPAHRYRISEVPD